MKNNIPTGEGGLIKMLLLIVVAILILSYFGFSIRNLANKPVTQDNFTYVASTTVVFWNKYLEKPATYLWRDVFLDLIWGPAISNLRKMKDGEPTDIDNAAPKLPPAQTYP